MNNPLHNQEQQRRREASLYWYHDALNNGDLEALNHFFDQAQDDPILLDMMEELHDALQDEQPAYQKDAASDLIRNLLRQHFPDEFAESTSTEEQDTYVLRPLTLGDAAARVRADTALPAAQAQEANSILQQPGIRDEPLPDKLTPRAMRLALERLGISVSECFSQAMRDCAVLLSMGRQQTLAATRRQQEHRVSESSHTFYAGDGAESQDTTTLQGQDTGNAPEETQL